MLSVKVNLVFDGKLKLTLLIDLCSNLGSYLLQNSSSFLEFQLDSPNRLIKHVSVPTSWYEFKESVGGVSLWGVVAKFTFASQAPQENASSALP